MIFHVLYRTVAVQLGTATVDADGIHSAQESARKAVSILCGQPLDAITMLVVKNERHTTLWWNDVFYQPSDADLMGPIYV